MCVVNCQHQRRKLSYWEYLIGVDRTKCAACGKKVGEDGMMINTCNKCDLVVYCNAACKKKHRSKHKKKCDRRVAELHEEALFKEPPPPEDCPICFLPLPLCAANQITHFPCCGNDVCDGCVHAMFERQKEPICPFCRSTRGDDAAIVEKLMKVDSGKAIYMLGYVYSKGTNGLEQDWKKANELWLKAGELGHPKAYYKLAYSYCLGRGVGIDKRSGTCCYGRVCASKA